MDNNNNALTSSIRNYTIPTDGIQNREQIMKNLLYRFNPGDRARFDRIMRDNQPTTNQQRKSVIR